MKLYSFSQRYLAVMIAATVVCVFLCAFSAMSADWPQWRGPNRDGISSETGWSYTWPADGPKQLWNRSLGIGYATVSVSGDRAYTVGNKDKIDTVYCLDVNTGEDIWKYSYPCATESGGHKGPASTPTVDGKNVYTLSREGHLFCFDADSGKVIWGKHLEQDFGAKHPEWDFACSVLVLDNMVIVDAGMAIAVDKSTGELVWKTKDYGVSWDIKNQGGGYSSPYAFQLNGSQRLSVFNSSGLVILDPKSGQELMLHPWKTSYNINAATPIVSGDKLFISSGYKVGAALLQISGDKPVVIWQNKEMRNQFSSCVLWEGHLYGFDDKKLKCMEWETGNVKWTQSGLGMGSLMLADGKMIIMSDKGKLVIAEISPDSYKELASAKVLSGLCWTVPVLANGKIYCRNHDGELLCLDVKGSN